MSVICTVEELSDHEQVSCGQRRGAILAVGVLKANHGITDFSSESQWNAAILADTAKIIKGIKGSMPAASPVEGDSPTACGSATVLDGFDNTVAWKDYSVTNNTSEFYRQLNSSEFTSLVLYFCQDDEVQVIEKKVRFVALPQQSTDNNKEKQFYDVTAKWSTSVSDNFPVIWDAPDNIFV